MFFELKKLKEMDFVSLDIETTGLYPKSCDILEIGLLHFSKNQIQNECRTYIKPEKFSNGAMSINGITENFLKDAPTLNDFLPELFSLINRKALVIQNAEFDLSFLFKSKHAISLFADNTPVYCTLQLARKYFPSFSSYSLDSLRKEFKISEFRKFRNGKIHEALDDCYAAMIVFIECANKGNLWEKDFFQAIHHQKNLKTIKDYKQKFT